MIASIALALLQYQPEAQAGVVGSGKIVGGWEYVYVAYGLTLGGMLLYGLSLWARRPKG